MDISRSIFPLSHPRQRLDAGTYATMGVGLGYAIAAWTAYNLPPSDPQGTSQTQRKKVIAFEGDSAFGFSAMELETMARQGMDVLIFVMNNSGIYHGDTFTKSEWDTLRSQTVANMAGLDSEGKKTGLRSTSLWYETRYETLAEMFGGKGYFVRTEEELETATLEGFKENRVVVVNVVIEPGVGRTIGFAWQQQGKEKEADGKGRDSKL